MLQKGKHPGNQRSLTPSILTYQKIAAGMSMPVDDLLRLIDGSEPVSVGAQSLFEEFKDLFLQQPPEIQELLFAQLKGIARSQGDQDEQ